MVEAGALGFSLYSTDNRIWLDVHRHGTTIINYRYSTAPNQAEWLLPASTTTAAVVGHPDSPLTLPKRKSAAEIHVLMNLHPRTQEDRENKGSRLYISSTLATVRDGDFFFF